MLKRNILALGDLQRKLQAHADWFLVSYLVKYAWNTQKFLQKWSMPSYTYLALPWNEELAPTQETSKIKLTGEKGLILQIGKPEIWPGRTQEIGRVCRLGLWCLESFTVPHWCEHIGLGGLFPSALHVCKAPTGNVVLYHHCTESMSPTGCWWKSCKDFNVINDRETPPTLLKLISLGRYAINLVLLWA